MAIRQSPPLNSQGRPPKPRELRRQQLRELEQYQRRREYPQPEVAPWKPLG
ncbi:hypothetical protein PSQ40_05015 [Curvibacter sp. HBC61]|uniref:Uncharacterized protein n=1 Tax=Curvibacter cyanobacteriorum TaxID=3026422 RepID=A0ABT5MV47_9BURK|nr:hypothetical protein [Curvibacter sp. HBC61]MDD0837927.1 hypothetical protein [Curvibacter sp. HBC61]